VDEHRPSILSRFLSSLRVAAEPGRPLDNELLARFLDRAEGQAFAELVHRHGPLVLSAARAVLGDGADAEDVFQATFLVLARRAASIRQRGSVGGWLYGVARRLALKARRAAARRRGHEARAAGRAEANTMHDFTRPERDRLLHDAIGRLPDKYRLPVLLCYWEGRTQQQAAAQLGWPKHTFRDRLERARELLRARLARHGLALPAAALAVALAEARAAAAVPPALTSTTVDAALLFAAGQAGPGSAAAASLARKGLREMSLTKLRFAALVAVGILTAVGAALAYQGRGPTKPGEGPPAQAGSVPRGKELRRADTEDVGKGPLEDKSKDGWRHVLLGRHHTSARGAVLDPGGRRLITIGERDDVLKVWDVKTLKLERAYKLDYFATFALAQSPDGRTLAVSAGDPPHGGAVLLVDAGTMTEIRRLPVAKDGAALGLAFSPDGRQLAVATQSVALWDWKAGRQTATYSPAAKTQSIRKLAYTPDGSHLVVNCQDELDAGTVRVCHLGTAKEVAARAIGSQLLGLAVTGPGEVAISARQEILLWGWRDGGVKAKISPPVEALRDEAPRALQFHDVAASPDGKRLAVSVLSPVPPNNLTQVRVLDRPTGKVLHRLEIGDANFDCWRWAPDGRVVICTQWNGSVWLLTPQGKEGQ
jgi:RNA polymerase sigma factor (sigma-70 family)